MIRLSWITVRGDSMWPSLKSGDAILCEAMEGAPAVGEILVAKLPTGVVAHRVARVEGSAIVLRGDNCGYDDAPISAFEILGRVVRVRRGGAEFQVAEVDRGASRIGAMRLSLKRRVGTFLRRAQWG